MKRVSSIRFTSPDITAGLGLLAGLSGTWKGQGFNLIARPDFVDKTDLYLQLNHTRETLKFTPIGSPIPNRGFGQDDIELFGLTYLQQIADAGHDGALHIEPGIWITQPNTAFPPDGVPNPPDQLVARMGTIPHGNSILAQGVASPFEGVPILAASPVVYNFSEFPSFNSTPFGVPPTAPGFVFNAAGSSEKLTAPQAPGSPPPFPQYDLSIPAAPVPLPPALQKVFNLNTRTPFETSPLELPFDDTPDNQALVNDPIVLLQREITKFVDLGYSFSGFTLNVATQSTLTFLTNPNSAPTGPTTSVTLPQFTGGIENIRFLNGAPVPVGGAEQTAENAQTAIVYATFWVETVTNAKTGHEFVQLQYAQMVVLNFPIFHLLNPTVTPPPAAFVNLGWPHITVGTLRKTFG